MLQIARTGRCLCGPKLPLLCTTSTGLEGGDGRKAYCDTTEGQLVKKTPTKYNIPKDSETLKLKSLYPNAKELIDSLYEPFTSSEADRWKIPSLFSTRRMNGTVHRATMQLHWPQTAHIAGVHTEDEHAHQNAYLMACSLFRNMGLLTRKQETFQAVSQRDVQGFIEELSKRQTDYLPKSMGCNFSHGQEFTVDGISRWRSSVNLAWPVVVNVSTRAHTLDLSHYQACLLTAIRLKAQGFLTDDNRLVDGSVKRVTEGSKYGPDFAFTPDCTFFVDASKIGFGAFLIEPESDTINWISDRWTAHSATRSKFGRNYSNTSLAEFYALVTASLTWKEKFRDKKVLCYCDNLHAVGLVNNGLYQTTRSSQRAPFLKLFTALANACTKYNITLLAAHVPRVNNMAADSLSKHNLKAFRNLVPMANSKPVLSKKPPLFPGEPDPDDWSSE